MPKQIVCNTGPLIALSLIGMVEVLGKLFRPIIPKAVLEEWNDGDSNRILPSSIKVVETPKVDPLIALQLDAGEASVIQTAIQESIATVLIDERKGRKIARRIYGLTTIGTARVLVEAKKAGYIKSVGPLFTVLRHESYWISKPIVNWALAESKES